MTITRHGGGTAIYNPSSSQTIAWPASVTADHAAIIVVNWYENGGGTLNAITGFTQRGSTTTIGGTTPNRSLMAVLTRDCDGTETGNITIGFSGSIYAGVTLTVLDGDGALTYTSISSFNTGNGTAATAPAVTTTSGQAHVAAYGVGDPPGANVSDPSGMTVADDSTGTTNGSKTYFMTATGGDSGTKVWTYTNTRDWGAASILFDDAGGGGGGGGQPAVKRFGGVPGMAINRGVW